MQFLNPSNTEWTDLWQELAELPINGGDAICAFEGKSWEYMGSSDNHHHLQHPKHPKTGRSEFIYLERRYNGIMWADAG